MWQTIETAIFEATGEAFLVESAQPISGGCINEAYCLSGHKRSFFVKLNSPDKLDMLASEAAGLTAIRLSNAIRTPEPVCTGADDSRSWLVLEFVSLQRPQQASSSLLGEQLANMHRHTAAAFGWDRDNYIGTTPQTNTPNNDWLTFLREQRIGFQLGLAQGNGASSAMLDRGYRLLQEIPALFNGYQPIPSLLHGDLWGGNRGFAADGSPVLFDPAVYFGDREADLAMTELFGGFDDRFYQSYRHAWTLDPGYRTRKVLYNLYHILNHYNLFGGGYDRQALGMIDSLLADLS